jgi:hypothetical protein
LNLALNEKGMCIVSMMQRPGDAPFQKKKKHLHLIIKKYENSAEHMG